MLRLLEQGQGLQAIEMLVDLLARLQEAHTSTAQRLKEALRQLDGRRSEKTPANELQLLLSFLSAEGAAPTVSETTQQTPPSPSAPSFASGSADGTGNKPPPRRQAPRGAQALPAHLERREVVVPVPPEQRACPSCGQQRTPMGEEVSQRLELEPARFFVQVEKRPKLSCTRCKEGVVCAPAAEAPLPGALPGPGLLAQLLVGKYRDGLPLHRQQAIFDKRYGVKLPPSTLGDWLAGACDVLPPLVQRLKQKTLQDFLVQTDDTGLRVLDKDDPRGIKRGHLWPYVGEGGNLFVEYTPDWSGEGPQKILSARQGYIQADGYAGYDALFTATSPRTEVACWMHARRGFEKAFRAGEPRAALVLSHIQQLYAVEREATERGLSPQQRGQLRLEKSASVYTDTFALLEQLKPQVAPKTPLGKAITYAQNRYLPLGRFLEDGRLPLDNGEVERLIRLIAIGRNNYLFAGSDAAGQRAALAYTLVLSCYRLGMDPWAYLRDVLPKLGDTRFPAARLAELLPEAWLQQQRQQM
ncbi:transposase and inactivated derivative [Stigmatella aurantiaca DW4/3-1]|uniref:Transposase and inactivated derivative n=1 Tax=Stigmatella aurantiaca (strain DW4/3-1) TaxID=378806 RepID=Q08VL0_STIAD|nr:transposase and inactivated derivative [Stigmatella aurantiaca DW4/3-1]